MVPIERSAGKRSPMGRGKPRVAILARHHAQRAELFAMLDRGGAVTVAGEFENVAELSASLDSTRPDVILFDDETAERSRLFEYLAVIGIGAVTIAESVCAADIVAGSSGNGWGVVLRDATPQELSGALVAVAAGLDVADPRISETSSRRASAPAAGPIFDPATHLSPREKEVLELISRGMPNKQIAAHLGISSHTVKFHIGSLLVKLGAASRAEAVTVGARRGELAI